MITVKEVRLISSEGKFLGIKNIREAIELARNQSLDVVEIVPNVIPPVCKIMDYSKFKYEEEKRESEKRKKQKLDEIKEIRLRPRISDHDLEFKISQMRDFLKIGYRIKVAIYFSRDEIFHREFGIKLIEKIKEKIQDIKCEIFQTSEGNRIILKIFPKK